MIPARPLHRFRKPGTELIMWLLCQLCGDKFATRHMAGICPNCRALGAVDVAEVSGSG